MIAEGEDRDDLVSAYSKRRSSPTLTVVEQSHFGGHGATFANAPIRHAHANTRLDGSGTSLIVRPFAQRIRKPLPLPSLASDNHLPASNSAIVPVAVLGVARLCASTENTTNVMTNNPTNAGQVTSRLSRTVGSRHFYFPLLLPLQTRCSRRRALSAAVY